MSRIKRGIILFFFLIIIYFYAFPANFKCEKRGKVGWGAGEIIKSFLGYYGINVSEKEVMKAIKEEGSVPVYKIIRFLREKGIKTMSFRGNIKKLNSFIDNSMAVVVVQWASEKLKKRYLRVVVKRKSEIYYLCEPSVGKLVKFKKDRLMNLWKGGDYWGLIILKDAVSIKKDDYYWRDEGYLRILKGDYENAKVFFEKALRIKEDSSYRRAVDCINKKDTKCLKGILKDSLHIEPLNKKEENDFITSFFVSLFI